jgi:hypothetical protein
MATPLADDVVTVATTAASSERAMGGAVTAGAPAGTATTRLHHSVSPPFIAAGASFAAGTAVGAVAGHPSVSLLFLAASTSALSAPPWAPPAPWTLLPLLAPRLAIFRPVHGWSPILVDAAHLLLPHNDLQLLILAFCVRWVWLHHVEPSRPWALFQVTPDKVTAAFFRASIALELGDGKSFLFWTDPWLHGQCIDHLAPDLLDAVPMTRRKQRSIAFAVADGAWTQDILGPLTIPVLMQFLDIHNRIQQVHLSPESKDRLI